MISAGAQDGNNKGGCVVAALVVGIIVMISQCSGDESGSNNASETVDSSSVPSVVADPPPAQSLSRPAVVSGARHLRLVLGAGEPGGAEIYSRNCYEGLAQTFSWDALDRCGGFDRNAVSLADRGEELLEVGQASHFDPEAAAGRYLKAAIEAGLATEAADERWEQLKNALPPVLNALPPQPTPAPSDEEWILDDGSDEAGAPLDEEPSKPEDATEVVLQADPRGAV